jgi:DNA-binding NarL/FixJ family response regulator
MSASWWWPARPDRPIGPYAVGLVSGPNSSSTPPDLAIDGTLADLARSEGHVSDEEVLPGIEGQIRVMICDDHALFRRGLKMVLEAEPDIDVIAEAEDGETAVAEVAEHVPDVVLMDVRMPTVDGIEATRRIAEEVPSTKIVMLTVSDEEADLYEAIKAGATGYLLKEISIEEVASAVRAVVAGQSLISPSMASKLLTEFTNLAKRADERTTVPTPRLTDRELEVLRLVAQGKSNREIAGDLYISENTVKNHVRNILEKLHLHTRMEAVMYAVREKLLDIPGSN